jgi:hypothetical protein
MAAKPEARNSNRGRRTIGPAPDQAMRLVRKLRFLQLKQCAGGQVLLAESRKLQHTSVEAVGDKKPDLLQTPLSFRLAVPNGVRFEEGRPIKLTHSLSQEKL